MVTEATKKNREIFAYGLLGVAALYFISGLSLLFKSGDDLGGAGFADKAALFGYVFTHPLLVISLFGAVALATGFGENSKNAKTIVTAALGIGAVSLLFGVICWLSAFGADTTNGFFSGFGFFNGVFGAGKVVGIFLGLAQLGLLGLVTFYAFTAFQTFPKTVKAQQNQGWGQQQGGWGQPGSYDQGQQGWGQQQGGWGQPGAYDQGQQGWGQHQGGYDQGQQSWGAASTGGWGEQPSGQAEQPGQQGQPASSWEQLSTPHTEPSGQQTWGQPDQAQGSQGWGQPEQPPAGSWGSPSTDQPAASPYSATHAPESATPASDETQVWSPPAEGEQPSAQSDPERKDDDNPPPQQGWWQQPSQ